MKDEGTEKAGHNRKINMQDSIEECLDYFKGRKGFLRLLSGVRDKYVSLGYMGGSVRLANLNLEEKSTLTGFLKKDYMHQKSAVIKISSIEAAICQTKFSGISLQEIVEGYFNENLSTRKEEIGRQQDQWNEFFDEFFLNSNLDNSKGINWLKQVIGEKRPPFRLILKKYNTDKKQLNRELKIILPAFSKLPVFSGRTERLAVFAAQISGNPHFLDQGSEADRLFTYGICHILKTNYPDDLRAERKAEILYEAGLLIDEISNFTVSYGLEATTRNGEAHKGFLQFKEMRQPLHVSLANLSGILDLKAVNNVVYVVENPAVFAGILDALSDEIKNKISIICSNGQPRLATIVTLDLLVKNKVKVLYSGDFDPEGLLIADKLKIRYGDYLEFWRFDEKDYSLAKSKKSISSNSLQKLKKIISADLRDLAKSLEADQRAGYQENILELYIEDLMPKTER